ncbi:MAG TPA: ATP-dependent protease ATPase subunit HslU [Nitrospirales bacterium]|nr:ATP-dependent protease ATPase subunit HslU [Nitrospirales bacterium]
MKSVETPQSPPTPETLESLTPRQIVEELDRYVVGQRNAKRMVAIALRTRWRMQRLPEHLQNDIIPKNIIMIGPTGVGKTEISRRLAKLSGAPFLKVEASKFTEVGYVGRDVESLIRDLTELSVNIVKAEHHEQVQEKAKSFGEDRLLDLMLPPPTAKPTPEPQPDIGNGQESDSPTNSYMQTREKLRAQLRAGKLDDRNVEIETKEKSIPIGVISNVGMEEIESNLREALGGLFPAKKNKRTMKIDDALKALIQEEAQKLIDMDEVFRLAVHKVEQTGIVFLDEIDKIAGKERSSGPDISREGVQRDLLPIVEGCAVNTKYGIVRTDHILFIAAGAFHVAKPSDLIPELQGRFPIRVELEALSKDDFVRILTEPNNALITQYRALIGAEGVDLQFTDDAVKEIAEIAVLVNERSENIGARRLFTILELLLDEVSFDAPELTDKTVPINADYVRDRLKDIVKDEDLSRYIL